MKRLIAFSISLVMGVCIWGQDIVAPARVTLRLSEGRAADAPKGPFKPDWKSIEKHYTVPQWFKDGKFGIFIHWGVYSVPAHGSEWYPKHMYGGLAKYHTETWGNPKDFGYKNFIPLFKAEHFDPEAWARLFKDAGATYVIPTAEHHDGFALYNSDLTRWDAVDMGPKRDLIGDLCKAVRAQGMKFGVSNHRVENWDFMYPTVAKETDLFDPEYADLYGPPQKPTENSGMGPKEGAVNPHHPQSDAFMEEWLARCEEIIDKYHPDLLYFDNGINYRSMDPYKMRLAAYYYNSAEKWGAKVSVQSKSDAFLAGSIRDYERQNRAPKERTRFYWQVDEPIGNKFGYIEGLQIQSAKAVINKLVDNISRNGNLCLNVSPKADGTIPENQQEVLREIGRWMHVCSEGVYGTTAWKVDSERADKSIAHAEEYRFTAKGKKMLFAFRMKWNGGETMIRSITAKSFGKVRKVTLLGCDASLDFKLTEQGLYIHIPVENPTESISVFKIER